MNMKSCSIKRFRRRIFFLSILALFSKLSSAQTHLQTDDLMDEAENENITVKKIASDKNSSTFMIFIRDSVAAHYHESHTESLIILAGHASMRLGDKSIQIKKGDFLNIPEKTIHSVQVTSKTPLKVISIQAPEFLGKDRHYIKDN